MQENGESKKSMTGEVISLLEDQMELASLEWKYEKGQSVRRIAALAVAGILGLTAFTFLQIVIVQLLARAGWSLLQSAGLLLLVYGATAGLLAAKYCKRDSSAGEPFQGSRQEIQKNLEWIRKLFS